jgi:hypothetical protein
VALAGVVGVLAAGCSSGSTTQSARPTIRGAQVPTFSCGARATTQQVEVAPAAVTGLLLCRSVPVYNRVVRVTPSDRVFTALVRALSVPDEPRASGACPAYADVPQPVVARTASETLVVHIPVDGCGHYQREPLQALHAARTGR